VTRISASRVLRNMAVPFGGAAWDFREVSAG
jgi:hypothetical protein